MDDGLKGFEKLLDIKPSNISPAQGKLLVSEPFLKDYFFGRSVVLLAEHNEEGTFGLILNKPTEYKLNDITKDFPDFDVKIHLGGPVQTENMFFIHTLGEIIEGSLPIMDNLYWGGDIQIVKEMIAAGSVSQEQIRFFIGYSGWVPEQLDDELKAYSWVISNGTSKEIMNRNASSLWERKVKQLGKDYIHWLNFPEDPESN